MTKKRRRKKPHAIASVPSYDGRAVVDVRIPEAERADHPKRWSQLWRHACRVVNQAGQYALVEYERGTRLARIAIYTKFLSRRLEKKK